MPRVGVAKMGLLWRIASGAVASAPVTSSAAAVSAALLGHGVRTPPSALRGSRSVHQYVRDGKMEQTCAKILRTLANEGYDREDAKRATYIKPKERRRQRQKAKIKTIATRVVTKDMNMVYATRPNLYVVPRARARFELPLASRLPPAHRTDSIARCDGIPWQRNPQGPQVQAKDLGHLQ